VQAQQRVICIRIFRIATVESQYMCGLHTQPHSPDCGSKRSRAWHLRTSSLSCPIARPLFYSQGSKLSQSPVSAQGTDCKRPRQSHCHLIIWNAWGKALSNRSFAYTDRGFLLISPPRIKHARLESWILISLASLATLEV
jgi:hypothetical protein